MFTRKSIWFTLLLLGLFVLLVASCGQGSPSPTPSAPTPEPIATATTAAAPSPSADTGATHYTLAKEQDSNIPGVPAGVTDEGVPYRGDPNAPVTIEEYSDFQCPFCRRYAEDTEPQIVEKYLKSGKVRILFHQFPLRNLHPQADLAAQAALCAGVQGKFWPMHDMLFERQSDWSGKGDAEKTFREFAQKLGLDEDAFARCLKAQPFADTVEKDIQAGQAKGVRGTPTFFVNGWTITGAESFGTFQGVIEKALKGERPTPTPTPSYGDLHPFEPNPETPGRTYMGDAYIGSGTAPVVLLEISDPLCPYCKKHHLEVWPDFKKEFVDTGKVRVVYKHLLGRGPKSLLPAEAAECAGNQQRFFDYIDTLFAHVDEWSKQSGDTLTQTLVKYADELGLDTKAFSTCLEKHEMREKVQRDSQTMIRANVRSTPTFIVIVGDRSLGRIPGFLTMDQWRKVMAQVDDALKQIQGEDQGKK